MPSKERRAWYENALLLTVAGSIIVVVGQLASTIIPIMYGPSDISDFTISVNPPYCYASMFEQDNKTILYFTEVPKVKITNVYPRYIRSYPHSVYIRAIDAPPNMSIRFSTSSVKADDPEIDMRIEYFNRIPDNVYPITIQGIGGDDKRRNTTIFFIVRGRDLELQKLIEGNYIVGKSQTLNFL